MPCCCVTAKMHNIRTSTAKIGYVPRDETLSESASRMDGKKSNKHMNHTVNCSKRAHFCVKNRGHGCSLLLSVPTPPLKLGLNRMIEFLVCCLLFDNDAAICALHLLLLVGN